MSDLYRNRSMCRLCESEELQLVLPLVPTPVGDKYLPSERRDETRQTIPLDLYMCRSCGHLQTGAVVNPSFIYKHYLSRPAAVNSVLSDAYQEYAEHILTRFKPTQGSLIVEIGSNDGAFINFFRGRGISVLGVDPAENLAETATKGGIETIPTFFSSEVAKEIKKNRGDASAVVANFMYANVDDLDDLTRGIRALLTPDGVFMFETNYRVDVFQKDLVETVNHEHLSYFSVKPLQTFFARHDMELIDVKRVPSKGGSIRCTAQLSGGPHEVSMEVEKLIAYEEDLGIYDGEFYRPCGSHIQSVREELQQILSDFKSQDKIMAGYGTSIGATIFIYQLGLSEYLKFLVDDDPYRQNLVSPGYHIPVVPAKALFDERVDYVLILAPLYSEKIMSKNQAYKEQGGHFIVIWPEVKVY